MSTPATPTTVEPGQIWRDNDQRTKGSGEFVVLAVIQPSGRVDIVEARHWATVASRMDRAIDTAQRAHGKHPLVIVKREGGRLTRIRGDRLVDGANTRRGYTYLGMSK